MSLPVGVRLSTLNTPKHQQHDSRCWAAVEPLFPVITSYASHPSSERRADNGRGLQRGRVCFQACKRVIPVPLCVFYPSSSQPSRGGSTASCTGGDGIAFCPLVCCCCACGHAQGAAICDELAPPPPPPMCLQWRGSASVACESVRLSWLQQSLAMFWGQTCSAHHPLEGCGRRF